MVVDHPCQNYQHLVWQIMLEQIHLRICRDTFLSGALNSWASVVQQESYITPEISSSDVY